MWLALAVIGGALLFAVWRKHKARQETAAEAAAPGATSAPHVATAPAEPPPSSDTRSSTGSRRTPLSALPAEPEPDPATMREAMRNAQREMRLTWAVPPSTPWEGDELDDRVGDWGDEALAWADDEGSALHWDDQPLPACPVPWDPSTWPPLPSLQASPPESGDVLKKALERLAFPPEQATAIAERLGFIVEQLPPAQLAVLESRLRTAAPDDLMKLRELLAPLASMQGDETVLVAARALVPALMQLVNLYGGAP
jgi:hypothetical protein